MKKLYASTKLETLSIEEFENTCHTLLEYCIDNLGLNWRLKNVPPSINLTSGDQVASYDPYDNKINFFMNNVKTLGMFTSTYIHEYTHYLQPCKTKYNKLLSIHGYSNHPFEIEARGNEKKHNRLFLNYLRKKLEND